jgi:phospholipid/cholesterol/gamma-HCH transport system permease protein
MNAAIQDMLLIRAVRAVGEVTMFLGRVVVECGPALLRPRLIVHQIYNTGARSLIIVMLSGFFVGAVLGLLGFDILQRFGSEEGLGAAGALGLVKELAPVVTALLFAGRAGTSLTS